MAEHAGMAPPGGPPSSSGSTTLLRRRPGAVQKDASGQVKPEAIASGLPGQAGGNPSEPVRGDANCPAGVLLPSLVVLVFLAVVLPAGVREMVLVPAAGWLQGHPAPLWDRPRRVLRTERVGPSELSMLVYVSTKAEARDALDQVPWQS